MFCGGDPKVVFMDREGNEIDEIDIVDLDEEEIGTLLTSKGFLKYS